MQPSSKFSLNLLDYGKAFILAILTAVIGAVVSSSQAGHLSLDPKVLLSYALAGASAFLIHSFTQPAPFDTTTAQFVGSLEQVAAPLFPIVLSAASARVAEIAGIPATLAPAAQPDKPAIQADIAPVADVITSADPNLVEAIKSQLAASPVV